jgi:PadR family transcriptional regulator, regulatory protein AphA
MSNLSPTARVILGMLRLGLRTGYDIKKGIDLSTRFFWGASYGQIYPELKRLTEAGLVRANPRPRGKVKRNEYTLTKAGERALQDWLTDTDSIYELRDEGLLRLFFGDLVSKDDVLANLRARREIFELYLKRFREIEVGARTGFAEDSQLYPYLALTYGIGLLEFSIAWYEETERRLEAGEPLTPAPVPETRGAGGRRSRPRAG